jgi:ubiquinone/menaquinone biosynthesis C-methylase UbiE
VLILGEGDGRFLARLLEWNQQATITVMETSARMIDLARRRLRDADHLRVKFYQADAVTCVLPDGQFDLAVTHFFLDVLDSCEAEAVIGKVSAALSPGAVWLVSEFQEPSPAIRRLHARLWLWSMYRFFALATGLRVRKLPPYREMLERCGLQEIEHRERRFGLIRSQVYFQTNLANSRSLRTRSTGKT